MRRSSYPQATLHSLQEQFRELCILGMRGAAAIADFRDDPAGNLQVIKDSTTRMKGGLAELRLNLENAMRALPSGERIYCWECEALEQIAVNAGLSFEEITRKIQVRNGSVVELNLTSTYITDLTPLANLTTLKKLSLYSTKVSDLNPLASLTALEDLDLDSTKVSDLSPLASLTALEMLDLWETDVLDLSPLATLTTLTHVWLSDAPVLRDSASLEIIRKLESNGATVYKATPLAAMRN